MGQEFETQVLEPDVENITKKLRELGAKEEDEVLQKRWVYDIKPETEEATGEWLRLRQAGDSWTHLTYKKKTGKGLGETEEIEVEVDDFDKMAEILKKIELPKSYYQENRRKRFIFEEIEFTFDTWPQIPTILEIEARSEEKVREGLRLLGLEGKDVGHAGLIYIYKHYGIELHSVPELRFKQT